MLIRSLRAENFMKFRRLGLEQIPANGVIGIEGRNEGGKTTIGELIQFALFGKTLASLKSSVLELIHWDADHCSVELEFEIAEDGALGRYKIWREIDRYGTNYARVIRCADRTEVAAGILQVNETLKRLTRFGFDEYQRSFYLSEREAPHTQEQVSGFLDRMLGIDLLLRGAEKTRQAINELDSEFAKLQTEVRKHQQQIDKYLPNIAKIPELEAARIAANEQIERLKEDERRQQQALERVERTVKSRDPLRGRIKELASLPVLKLAAASGPLLDCFPLAALGDDAKTASKEVERVRTRLKSLQLLTASFESLVRVTTTATAEVREHLEGSGANSLPSRRRATEQLHASAGRNGRVARRWGVLFAVVCVVLAGVGLISWQDWWRPIGTEAVAPPVWGGFFAGCAFAGFLALVAFVRARGHVEAASEQTTQLVAIDAEITAERQLFDRLTEFSGRELLPGEVAGALDSVKVPAIDAELANYVTSYQQALAGVADMKAVASLLAEDEQRIVQKLKAQIGEFKAERDKAVEAVKKEISRRDRTETEIREFQKQEGRKAALEEQQRDLGTQSLALRAEIETRQLLIQLYDETVESVRLRAGPTLGKSLRRLLPALTGDRYRDLKVTPDFRLQVFTHEKSDFLAPHELSGGTFEGLSLGFRIAFSQAFVHAVVRGPQFLFLDEPFKAMDTERVARTLSALTRLSAELRQVFILLPGIEEEHRALFDLIYRVEVGVAEMKHGSAVETVETARDMGLSRSGTTPQRASEWSAAWPEELKTLPRSLTVPPRTPLADTPPEFSRDRNPPRPTQSTGEFELQHEDVSADLSPPDRE
ncbi:MAG: AAA family ATPase [Planctomycetota bacterium]